MFALADLAFLRGRFHGIDRMSASTWAPAESGASVSEAVPDLSQGVLVRRSSTTLRSGAFEVLDVFAADPNSNDLLMYSFDTMGFPPDPPARGGWVAGSIHLERTTPRGHSRTIFTPAADGLPGFDWLKDFRAADTEQWQRVVDGSLR